MYMYVCVYTCMYMYVHVLLHVRDDPRALREAKSVEVLHLALYLSRHVECNVLCRMESCVVIAV